MGKQLVKFVYELNSPKHCLLSSFLLKEIHNIDSKWKHYIDILPKGYSNFPIFFSDEELCLLAGSHFLMNILEKKEGIRKDYERICKEIPEFVEQYTFKEFCEVRMAVSSRLFCVKIKREENRCPSPEADLLNHWRPRQTHWCYDEIFKLLL
jgi:histone-lysine N-methyltransferase SETD3